MSEQKVTSQMTATRNGTYVDFFVGPGQVAIGFPDEASAGAALKKLLRQGSSMEALSGPEQYDRATEILEQAAATAWPED